MLNYVFFFWPEEMETLKHTLMGREWQPISLPIDRNCSWALPKPANCRADWGGESQAFLISAVITLGSAGCSWLPGFLELKAYYSYIASQKLDKNSWWKWHFGIHGLRSIVWDQRNWGILVLIFPFWCIKKYVCKLGVFEWSNKLLRLGSVQTSAVVNTFSHDF